MLKGKHTIWSNPRFQILTIGTLFFTTLFYLFHSRGILVRKSGSESHISEVPSIPKDIWHIFLHKRDIPPTLQPSIHSWSALNPQHEYHLIDTVSATNLLFDLYRWHPEIVHTYQRLESTVMRADFLRYVLLAVHGGVYTDVDTHAIRPVDEWIPEPYRNFTRVVVGIEYDQRATNDSTPRHVAQPRSLSLCQWTMAATANHPLLWHVVREAMWAIEDAADAQGTDIEHLRPTDRDIISITGPGLWTAAILKYLRANGHPNLSHADLKGLKEPELLGGDVLVLPIDAFGSGQPHSESSTYADENGNDRPTDERGREIEGALARHLFSMSWRHNCAGVMGDGTPCW